MNILQNLMTVTSNIISVLAIMVIGALIIFTIALDNNERQLKKRDRTKDS
jgi:ribose/xylose/arabinose/galactoside ABC-type transport system permease subunit